MIDAIPFEPMEARLVETLPDVPGWQFEPKWDGFRCLAVKAGADVALFAKSGKPLTRYFPEVVETLALLPGDLVLDGELVIPLGETFSFDALQQRLHPAASRVKKLAVETPATYLVFDLLADEDGVLLLELPLAERRRQLEHLVHTHRLARLHLSPSTDDFERAADWLRHAGGAVDGVVAKRRDAAYAPGERAMLKVKRQRTADCVVGGFRYASKDPLVGSLLLGLFEADGRLDHIGFVSGLTMPDRPELTRQLEGLRGGPGFTGNAPGGPSRWSTERSGEYEKLGHELVVEVRFDQVTSGRIRHGAHFVRWRPDKAPRQSTKEQLDEPAGGRSFSPAELLRA